MLKLQLVQQLSYILLLLKIRLTEIDESAAGRAPLIIIHFKNKKCAITNLLQSSYCQSMRCCSAFSRHLFIHLSTP